MNTTTTESEKNASAPHAPQPKTKQWSKEAFLEGHKQVLFAAKSGPNATSTTTPA
jgi:hypothetical protein